MQPDPFYLDGQHVYRSRVLEELPWLEHGFGTALSPQWTRGRPLTTVKQIHSDRVLFADGMVGCVGEGDALIATRPGTLVAILTADCLPVVIADPGSRAAAAVHAGWKGTLAGITAKTATLMRENLHSRIEDLVVAIGPGIGNCCFEVGPEVAERFQPFFPERSDLSGRTRIDLVEVTRRQLRRIGVQDGQIVALSRCSCCGGRMFDSYRRDRESAGRMVTAVGIKQ